MADIPPPNSIAEAQRLLDVWERLSRTHVMAGGGCACGVGGVVVALEDFEQDIADYLHTEAGRLQRTDVAAFLEAHGRKGELWSIPTLLTTLTGSNAQPHAAISSFVLERLGRTLLSFEKLHG